jgi:hypothetical protein
MGTTTEGAHTPDPYRDREKEDLMRHMSRHMAICVGLIGLGILLAAAGVSGAWVFLPFVGCMLMMGMMVWMMVGGTGHGRDKK